MHPLGWGRALISDEVFPPGLENDFLTSGARGSLVTPRREKTTGPWRWLGVNQSWFTRSPLTLPCYPAELLTMSCIHSPVLMGVVPLQASHPALGSASLL